ncbi:uncharacterized protein ACJ7VT_016258 [Polymixia lowei]
MGGNCSPSPVPIETTESRVSPRDNPMDQSPFPSPLASPCPRLGFSPGEDEDCLSPLFQPSLSEDCGGPPALAQGQAKKRLKQCAFCNRGDEPPLGQGCLVVFGPTPGYVPLHILNRRASSDRDNDCHDDCYHGNQGMPTCSSPDEGEESSTEFIEQLGPIGLSHDINVQSLFDPTGQCCAHLQCAAWSEGVCRGEGQSLLYVDKAIDSGSTQVCVFCSRLGASLRCRETGCGRSYHFPCAAATGTLQDWNQRHTLCSRHTHTVSSQCVVCCSVGDVSSELMCCCCGNRYHGSCLEPPLAPTPLRRAGWQCPHCRNCRVCRRCGVRSSGLWANHPSLCESCDPALPCPLCGEATDPSSTQDHLTCMTCYRCVHVECVGQAGGGWVDSDCYVCCICRPPENLTPHSPKMQSPTLAPPMSPTQAPPMSPALAPPISPTQAPPMSPALVLPMSPALVPPMSPTQAPPMSPALVLPMSPALAPPMSPALVPPMSPALVPPMSPALAPPMSPAQAPPMSPTKAPPMSPALAPPISPTLAPPMSPTLAPPMSPALALPMSPTQAPPMSPTQAPPMSLAQAPPISPTKAPPMSPTQAPPTSPTQAPPMSPTQAPPMSPTQAPPMSPTQAPPMSPTQAPPMSPTQAPPMSPTQAPPMSPTQAPPMSPTQAPPMSPTQAPPMSPTQAPPMSPTQAPPSSHIHSPVLSPTPHSPHQFILSEPLHAPTEAPPGSPTQVIYSA